MFGIVIPNRYQDIIQPLVESIHRQIPKPQPEIIIVADNHQQDYGFRRVDYAEPEFAFARSANLGIRALGQKDVVLLNDDCKILEPEFFTKLAFLARRAGDKPGERIGILSPLIVGCVGNPIQRWHERERWWDPRQFYQDVLPPEFLCFPCVYIRRAMLNETDLLNERIRVYGWDDEDLCRRAHKAQWRTAVTSWAKIQHGDGSADLAEGRGRSWSTSFVRRNPKFKPKPPDPAPGPAVPPKRVLKRSLRERGER